MVWFDNIEKALRWNYWKNTHIPSNYDLLGERSPTFREEMNCETLNMRESISEQIPQGMRDLKPDKPSEKDGGRWSKTSGSNERGAVNEAGTSDALAGERMSVKWW